MSIQQSVNQLIGLAATASALYAHSPAGQKAAHIKDLKAKEQVLTEQLTTAEKQRAAEETALGGRTDVAGTKGVVGAETEAKVYSELLDVFEERFDLDPTEENLKKITDATIRAEGSAAAAEAKRKAYQTTQERFAKARRSGLQEAIKEGQARVQNKQQTEEFQRKVGVREQIGFKPLSERRDFRRRLNDDTK